jgi:hypothetical protein
MDPQEQLDLDAMAEAEAEFEFAQKQKAKVNGALDRSKPPPYANNSAPTWPRLLPINC